MAAASTATRRRGLFPLMAPVVAALVILSGCGGTTQLSDDLSGPATASTTEPTSTTDVAAATSDSSSTTATTATTTTSAPSLPATSPDAPSGDDGADLLGATCESPEGFTISYPADWVTNDAEVGPPCTLFDPDSIQAAGSSADRAAAIRTWIDRSPFNRASRSSGDRGRALTTVDGRQAVRINGVAGTDGPLRPGTRWTRYVIDLSVGTDDGPGTLLLDVVDTGEIDFDAARTVLDRMVASIDIAVGPDAEGLTIARFEDGGAPLVVSAAVEGDELCLRAQPPADGSDGADPPVEVPPGAAGGECPEELGSDGLATITLGGDTPILAGTAGDDVYEVRATVGDETLAFLPVTVEGTTTRAWALPVAPDQVQAVVWYDVDGLDLGRLDLG